MLLVGRRTSGTRRISRAEQREDLVNPQFSVCGETATESGVGVPKKNLHQLLERSSTSGGWIQVETSTATCGSAHKTEA